MAARPTLDPLREAAQRLNEAEIERNRLIRALRSKRETLTDLAEAADVSLGTAHKLTRPSTIVSVGYEGRSVDELVDALVDAGVSVLVDVRENAISRKRGLSKRALAPVPSPAPDLPAWPAHVLTLQSSPTGVTFRIV